MSVMHACTYVHILVCMVSYKIELTITTCPCMDLHKLSYGYIQYASLVRYNYMLDYLADIYLLVH